LQAEVTIPRDFSRASIIARFFVSFIVFIDSVEL
jgi:hypothetical protein